MNKRKKIWEQPCGELSEVLFEDKILYYFISRMKDKAGMLLSYNQTIEFLGVIYSTNLKSVYTSKRYRQILCITDRRLYWKDRFTDLGNKSPTHVALASKVFQYDDLVWDTNYLPNSWNCHCLVDALSHRDTKKEQLTVSDSGRFDCIANDGWGFNISKRFPADPEQDVFFGKNFLLLRRNGQILRCDDDFKAWEVSSPGDAYD